MLLTERAIRQLIYNILLEGVREDADALRTLLADAPEALSQFEPLSMKPKWVNWLADRYVRNKYPADDTLEDALPVVAAFAAADAAISQKYGSNPQFKTAVDTSFPPSERKWTNPADAAAMSTAVMDTLLTIYRRPKDKLGIDRADTTWKNDEVGTFGPWKLYFPTNQQNSINIAGADPVTHKPYTTWCTARTAGSNLFYNYAGRGIMLFYAINTEATPEDPESRISIGFVRGKLEARGMGGGVTVDAKNRGLKGADLESIFGGYYTRIIERAEAVAAEHGGEHPVKTELDAAAQDVVKFKSMLSGLSDYEAGDLCGNVFGYGTKTVSLDVLIAAASHKSASVRARCAQNPSTPPHILEKLADDPVASVRHEVARRAPLHVLEKLADDPDALVRHEVAQNPSTPPHILEKLANDPDASVRHEVAQNPSTPPHILEKLADDPVALVRRGVARRAPLHVLEKLADDPDASVRHQVILREFEMPTPDFEKLADNPDALVRHQVARSRAPMHVLEKLADDPVAFVRVAVLYNNLTPLHVQEKLAFDSDKRVRSVASIRAARSHKARPEILEQLSSSNLLIVRRAVARNPKTPLSALRALSQDKDDKTRKAAKATLAKLQPMGETRRLAHRIIAELKRR